jgi:hypothetical protein
VRRTRRVDFRVVEFSVQDDHLHLIVEAYDNDALARGMKSFSVRANRLFNAALGRGRSDQLGAAPPQSRIRIRRMREPKARLSIENPRADVDAQHSRPRLRLSPRPLASLSSRPANRNPLTARISPPRVETRQILSARASPQLSNERSQPDTSSTGAWEFRV